MFEVGPAKTTNPLTPSPGQALACACLRLPALASEADMVVLHLDTVTRLSPRLSRRSRSGERVGVFSLRCPSARPRAPKTLTAVLLLQCCNKSHAAGRPTQASRGARRYLCITRPPNRGPRRQRHAQPGEDRASTSRPPAAPAPSSLLAAPIHRGTFSHHCLSSSALRLSCNTRLLLV